MKMDEILPFATMRMNLEGIMLNKSRTERQSLICGIQKIKLVNVTKKKKQTDIENKLVVTGVNPKPGVWD